MRAHNEKNVFLILIFRWWRGKKYSKKKSSHLSFQHATTAFSSCFRRVVVVVVVVVIALRFRALSSRTSLLRRSVLVVVRLHEIRYFRLVTDIDDSFGVETERLYGGQIVPAGGVLARILSRRRRAAVVFVHGGSSVARGRRREKANADANRHARANHLGSVFVPASFGAAQHEELRFV